MECDLFALLSFSLSLGPGPTAAITSTITITTQRERVLLVELLPAEYAHTHSTNRMASLSLLFLLSLQWDRALRPKGVEGTVMWLSDDYSPSANTTSKCFNRCKFASGIKNINFGFTQ